MIFEGENKDPKINSMVKVTFPREDIRAFRKIMETDFFMRDDYIPDGTWAFVGKCGDFFDSIKKDSLWKIEESYQTYRFMSGSDVIDVISQTDPKIEYSADVFVEEEENKKK